MGLAAELYSHYTTEYLAKFFCLKYRPTYHNNKQAAVLITQVVLINLTLQVSLTHSLYTIKEDGDRASFYLWS